MRRRARGGRRAGFALLMVLAHVAPIFLTWSLANGQGGALLNLEAALDRRDQRSRGALAALARGVALLETGLPPSDPYACTVEVAGTPEGAIDYVVEFASMADDRWSVSVARDPGLVALPEMPATFAPPADPGPEAGAPPP